MVRTVRLLATLALLAACTGAIATGPFEIRGRVVAIADGDTLTLLDASKKQHRIRLDGIDAPERGQPYSTRSRESLGQLAHERDAVAYCSKTDRYGRSVCRVAVGKDDVGLAQLRAGLAWFFRRYAGELPPPQRSLYEEAEHDARAQKRGLWRDASPTAPWDHRGSQRAKH